MSKKELTEKELIKYLGDIFFKKREETRQITIFGWCEGRQKVIAYHDIELELCSHPECFHCNNIREQFNKLVNE